MLQIVTQETLKAYLKDDWIDRDLYHLSQESNQFFTSDEWLLNSPPKRCLFDRFMDLCNLKEPYGFWMLEEG